MLVSPTYAEESTDGSDQDEEAGTEDAGRAREEGPGACRPEGQGQTVNLASAGEAPVWFGQPGLFRRRDVG